MRSTPIWPRARGSRRPGERRGGGAAAARGRRVVKRDLCVYACPSYYSERRAGPAAGRGCRIHERLYAPHRRLASFNEDVHLEELRGRHEASHQEVVGLEEQSGVAGLRVILRTVAALLHERALDPKPWHFVL